MMNRVSRQELAEALIELLPEMSSSRPPELSTARVDERSARYVTALRHSGDSEDGIFLLGRRAQRLSSLAAVVPSPFDRDHFGLDVGRISTLEATRHEEAGAVVRAAERAAVTLGYELLFVRVPTTSVMLPALIDHGFHIYGATVLYAGPAAPMAVGATDVERATEVSDIGEAARLARLGFEDTHFSRDSRLDRHRGRGLYEAWVKAEAERGAQVLIVRDGARIVATAVCRGNAVAKKHLGLEQWHLHILAVHPRYRGAGLGLRVASAALQLAHENGADVFQTGVDTAAISAQRVYARLGLLPRGSSVVMHRWLKRG